MQFLVAMLLFATEPPVIRSEGVVNAATQRPASAGGTIAPGTMISIHGIRFAPTNSANRVTLTLAGGKLLQLPVLSASWPGIEAWVPPETPLGPARLTVAVGGRQSEAVDLVIQPTAPGLFSANGAGWGPAALGGPNTLLATGISRAPDIFVGGKRARVAGFQLQPGHRSKIQIEIPADVPQGCFVPVYAKLDGTVSNTVTMAVGRSTADCRNAALYGASGSAGVYVVARTARTEWQSREESRRDEASALFVTVQPDSTLGTPILLHPPPGTCSTFVETASPESPLADSVTGMLSNAWGGNLFDPNGTVAINDGRRQLQLTTVMSVGGYYRRDLNGDKPQVTLDRETSITVSGGVLPPVQLAAPKAFDSPETARKRTIDIQKPQRIEWAGLNGGMFHIILMSATPRGATGMTTCIASADAGRFTVPPEMLGHLPRGRGLLGLAYVRRTNVAALPRGFDSLLAFSVFAREIEVMVE